MKLANAIDDRPHPDKVPPDRPLITVCILSWNRKDELLRCVDSCRNQTYKPIDLLVVDNGSTDGSAEIVEQKFPDARVVRLDKNYGAPGGSNRAIPYARGDYIFFVDSDGMLHNQAVERAFQAMSRDTRIGVIYGRSKLFSNLKQVDTTCDVGPESAGRFWITFSRGTSFYRKVMYDDIGVFPDDYVYNGEEEHLSYRMLDKGYLIFYEPTVILWHEKSDQARRREKEYVLGFANSLATNAELWPFELAIAYALRSLLIYPLRAARDGYLWAYIKNWPAMWARAIRIFFSAHHPICRKTMQTVWKLRAEKVTDPDEVFCVKNPYWKALLNYIFGNVQKGPPV